MQIRTDLAVERTISAPSMLSGIRQIKRGNVFNITEVIVESNESGRVIGKPKGRYITLESSELSRFSPKYQQMIEEFSEEISELIPDKGNILVVGLGNRAITPDSLGPRVASKVLATRHLQTELNENDDEFLHTLRPVSVLASGVLGETGIETAEIISAVCEKIKPTAVIAVDALACADPERLGTTIQMCDSGISPGSGVANHRRELSLKTLGVPVIAVGIPTVVDLHTIAESISGQSIDKQSPNMMVTPRDIDRLIEHSASIIAFGINLALQPDLSFKDLQSL
ncbi:MAG: GPR endopeptidase [Ruminococcus sp.]|nr:GPR endopeptidase [Ruminococcus sp.]